jgi:hypothetical protein
MEKQEQKSFAGQRFSSLIVLFTVGVPAVLTGLALITDPSGRVLDMDTSLLNGTMFSDFHAPGYILLVAIGFFSIITAVLTLANYRNYPTLIFYQGVILTGWIMAQIYLLTELHILQAVYGALGIMLMLLGNYLLRKKHMKAFY